MSCSEALAAALDYACRFGPIWPQTPAKTGYGGTRGAKEATCDEATIVAWWAAHPDAVPALLTGEPSGVIALDVDIKQGRNGLDTLEEKGVSFSISTPTSHTPSGGLHLLFHWPGHFVPTSVDKIGRGLEVKGDGAWITLPPGPYRWWDPHLGLETPLAPMPAWMVVEETKPRAQPRQRSAAKLSGYAEAALDSAANNIIGAFAGEQHTTLNRESFTIGQLAGGGVIPAGIALESLLWAAQQMSSHDRRRPWRPAEIERQVKAAFTDGLREPRTVPNAR